MAQTISDLPIDSTWQSINTLSGIAIGTEMSVDNKSIPQIILAEGTQPSANSTDGIPLTNFRDNKSSRIILAGSLEIWARLRSSDTSAVGTISVQEI